MIKFVTKTVFFLAILLICQSVWAGDKPDCSNPQGSYEESYCAEQAYNRNDRELNAVYQQLKKQLNKEQRGLLVNAQKGWLKVRDNDCELEHYGSRGGTGWYSNILNCKNEKTINRIKELKYLLSIVNSN